jgi:bifunctional non-homologous end joining protein LigD
MLAHRNGERVRLISAAVSIGAIGFPAIFAAVEALAVRTCTIDGEVIASNGNGLADFQLLLWRKRDDPAILCAFDLLHINGRDLRDEPIETRKASWPGS